MSIVFYKKARRIARPSECLPKHIPPKLYHEPHNIDFTTLPVYSNHNTNTINTTTSTWTDRFGFTVKKGKYLAIASAVFSHGNNSASGECSLRIRVGSNYSAGNTTLLNQDTYSSTTNIAHDIIEVESDNTEVRLQTKVNWPGRGTFEITASGAYITFVRIG